VVAAFGVVSLKFLCRPLHHTPFAHSLAYVLFPPFAMKWYRFCFVPVFIAGFKDYVR